MVIGTECARAKPIGSLPRGHAPRRRRRRVRSWRLRTTPRGRHPIAAGIPTVGVTTSQPSSALEGVGVSLCVKNFAEERLMLALESRGSREDGSGA